MRDNEIRYLVKIFDSKWNLDIYLDILQQAKDIIGRL